MLMSTKKKNITLFAFLLCFINFMPTRADEQNKYTIFGSLPDSIDNVYVYLTPIKSSGIFTFKDSTIVLMEDSAIVHRGIFLFTGIADNEKQIYTIQSAQHPFINGWVVIEPGSIYYSYQENDYKEYAYSKGTFINDYLTDSIIIPSMQMAQVGEMIMNGSIDLKNPEMSEMVSKMREQALNFSQNIHSFVLENIDNSVGEYFFLLYSSVLQKNDRDNILSNLSEISLNRYNAIYQRNSIPQIYAGQSYIPFRGKAPDNTYITLVDVVKKNKIVLVDFWASWCAPCIKEMPVLIQLYNDYKNKGLEIIGVSLDDSESLWKASIKQHDMSWIQMISNKDESDNIAELYGVVAIPHTVLINGNGEIIATQIRGQELIEKIKNELE